MSYRPYDENPYACGLANWGDEDFDCVPGPTVTLTHEGRFVSVAFCERCRQLVAAEIRTRQPEWTAAW